LWKLTVGFVNLTPFQPLEIRIKLQYLITSVGVRMTSESMVGLEGICNIASNGVTAHHIKQKKAMDER
jgi:hypothetical protein